MRTRIARNGQEQVLLGVWVSKALYDELAQLSDRKSTTIAELTRVLLERVVKTEVHRPDAEQIVQSLLDLSDADKEQLRQQLGIGRRSTRSERGKERLIARLKAQKAIRSAETVMRSTSKSS